MHIFCHFPGAVSIYGYFKNFLLVTCFLRCWLAVFFLHAMHAWRQPTPPLSPFRPSLRHITLGSVLNFGANSFLTRVIKSSFLLRIFFFAQKHFSNGRCIVWVDDEKSLRLIWEDVRGTAHRFSRYTWFDFDTGDRRKMLESFNLYKIFRYSLQLCRAPAAPVFQLKYKWK